MAYKVRFTITKASADQDAASILALDNADDVGLIDGYLSANNGTRDIEINGAVHSLTYTFPDHASWQAFYNAALPVWNRNSFTSKASNAGISVDVSVIENT